MVAVSSWGRLSRDEHEPVRLNGRAGVAGLIAATKPGLAYGMGRSYGDVCLNPGHTLWLTRGLDRFIAFDEAAGRIRCEAGVLLRDIQRLVIPRGWTLPVTPGTRMITVGGAIANDVHGKNHHRLGTFGDHVLGFTLVRTDGEVRHCGPGEHPDWHAATVGGLGLTGVITEAEIGLRRLAGPWMDTETIPYAGVHEFLALADESEADWEHTVSWLDCLSGRAGRGVFMRGNPAAVDAGPGFGDKTFRLPFMPPFSLVNRWTLKPFNRAYYQLKRWRAGRRIVRHEPFSYPLDGVSDWNRMYGPRGFYQYQSVVPRRFGLEAVQAMLDALARGAQGSFLAVLKTFGDRPAAGMMSFARPGVTLALDFPNAGGRTHTLLERLDAIVREAGGCLYPAKDARMPRDLFVSGYPRLNEFIEHRDPGIRSALSRRLLES